MTISEETKQHIEKYYLEWRADNLHKKQRSKNKTKTEELLRAAFTAGILCGAKEFVSVANK